MQYAAWYNDVATSGKVQSFNDIMYKYVDFSTLKEVFFNNMVNVISPEQKLWLCTTEQKKEEDMLMVIDRIRELHSNIGIVTSLAGELCDGQRMTSLIKLKKQGVSICEYMPISDAYSFQNVLEHSDALTDCVISGSGTTFNLKTITKQLKNRDIRIWSFGGQIATSGWHYPFNNPDTFYEFFVRPDDIYIYDKYFDVLLFSSKKAATLLHIYKKGVWVGDLSELIEGLNTPIPNACIPPYFAEVRANCRKRCEFGEKCNFCKNIIDMAKEMKKQGLEIKIEKDNSNAVLPG